jgi:hypothetical protein
MGIAQIARRFDGHAEFHELRGPPQSWLGGYAMAAVLMMAAIGLLRWSAAPLGARFRPDKAAAGR